MKKKHCLLAPCIWSYDKTISKYITATPPSTHFIIIIIIIINIIIIIIIYRIYLPYLP